LVNQHYTDYHELLKREDIDAVVIVTPTSTHAEIIKAAAAAGKHIFSEKPLAQTLALCDEAIAAVASAGVKLQLGFMRRFDPAYVLAKKKIDEAIIGNPVMFRSTSRDPRRTSLDFAKRENSGSLILDMEYMILTLALADGQRGKAGTHRGRLPGVSRAKRGR
jgi:predicted dehydrogenase